MDVAGEEAAQGYGRRANQQHSANHNHGCRGPLPAPHLSGKFQMQRVQRHGENERPQENAEKRRKYPEAHHQQDADQAHPDEYFQQVLRDNIADDVGVLLGAHFTPPNDAKPRIIREYARGRLPAQRTGRASRSAATTQPLDPKRPMMAARGNPASPSSRTQASASACGTQASRPPEV